MRRLYAYAADEFRNTKPLFSFEPLYEVFRRNGSRDDWTIDEATASRDYTQRRYWFAFLRKFDNFSRALTAKKPAEKCALRSEYLFGAYFSFPTSLCMVALSTLVLKHGKQFLICDDFAWKNRRFHRKRATKSMSAGTHCTEALL